MSREARVRLAPFAGTLLRATAFAPDGSTVPLAVDGGRLTPLRPLTPGETVTVDVVVSRPGWLSWALGSVHDERLTIRAPAAVLHASWLTVAAGAPVRIVFDQPVSAVSYATPGQPAVRLALAGPQRVISLPGLGGSGSAVVTAAARPWSGLECRGSPLRSPARSRFA